MLNLLISKFFCMRQAKWAAWLKNSVINRLNPILTSKVSSLAWAAWGAKWALWPRMIIIGGRIAWKLSLRFIWPYGEEISPLSIWGWFFWSQSFFFSWQSAQPAWGGKWALWPRISHLLISRSTALDQPPPLFSLPHSLKKYTLEKTRLGSTSWNTLLKSTLLEIHLSKILIENTHQSSFKMHLLNAHVKNTLLKKHLENTLHQSPLSYIFLIFIQNKQTYPNSYQLLILKKNSKQNRSYEWHMTVVVKKTDNVWALSQRWCQI